tara:strand:+ start:342 stop:1574 length:1233 start_codon:yes stop_codon:yes gene_type:complete
VYWFKSKRFDAKLFSNEEGIPLIFPCIFCHALANNRAIYKLNYTNDGYRRIKGAELVKTNISENTSEIINELKNFLLWAEVYCLDKKLISFDKHHNFPAELLNHYLNNVLIQIKGKSLEMAKKALIALRAYYNFLAFHGFTELKNLEITKDSQAIARENTNHRGVIKYFSPGLRAQLYANARCLRDECILRAAGTTGVRAKENIGFLLNDFVVGNKKYMGLLSLFQQLEQSPEQEQFEFWLQGKYSKGRRGAGGKSRKLYIPRDTLHRFKQYYDKERPNCDIDNLFVTEPSSGYLKAISPACVQVLFKHARKKILLKQKEGLLPDHLDQLQEKQTYHILRHSFGTDTFYDALLINGLRVDNVTPTSQPYLVTAALLGHVVNGRGAPATTKEYIRSCHLKIELNNFNHREK